MEKNTSQLIDDMIANLGDWRGAAFANVRKIILDADPEITEEQKWMGTPVWSHGGIVCLAKALKDKVKVTFNQGAHLADPDKVFNSELEGKQWRAIDIYRDTKINEASLKILVQAGVAYNLSRVKAAKKKPAK